MANVRKVFKIAGIAALGAAVSELSRRAVRDFSQHLERTRELRRFEDFCAELGRTRAGDYLVILKEGTERPVEIDYFIQAHQGETIWADVLPMTRPQRRTSEFRIQPLFRLEPRIVFRESPEGQEIFNKYRPYLTAVS